MISSVPERPKRSSEDGGDNLRKEERKKSRTGVKRRNGLEYSWEGRKWKKL